MISDELNESEIGTQKFWDIRYETEIKNFRAHGDIGDVWFGEGSMKRVCNWILRNPNITTNSTIIDLGCGNGAFLIELAKKQFENLTGVDYSEPAILLAKEIATKQHLNINYLVFDILIDKPSENQYNLVHDKGTYDAISLTANSKTNRQNYMTQINKMLNPNGLFIITSCNWTKKELETHFSTYFTVHEIIPTPSFTFGGQTGNIVVTVVFKKCTN